MAPPNTSCRPLRSAVTATGARQCWFRSPHRASSRASTGFSGRCLRSPVSAFCWSSWEARSSATTCPAPSKSRGRAAAILNGRTDLRFEIEHAELGGLVFRLNSLLNQLMGVQEDDTDEDGRPSRPPAASDFSDALAVDERSVAARNVDLASRPLSGGSARRLLPPPLPRIHRRQALARRSGRPHHGSELHRAHPHQRKRDAREARQAGALPRRGAWPRGRAHRRAPFLSLRERRR